MIPILSGKSWRDAESARWSEFVATILITAGVTARGADAQCLNWGTEFAQVGPNSIVRAITSWDDGTGPALYIGGEFSGSVGFPAGFIAKWDGSSWTSLGSGPDDLVACLTVFDDGGGAALFAGGAFQNLGVIHAEGIAKWDGVNWTALPPLVTGSGPPGVWCAAVYDDGAGPALFVGGGFYGANGVPSEGIIKWDGTAWSSVGGGVQHWPVEHMVVYDDGTGSALYVSGSFLSAGGVPARRLAKWDGTTWSSLGANPDLGITALATYDDGTGTGLYVGGAFSQIGGITANRIAKWNGTSWASVGSLTGTILALVSANDGRGPALFAGNAFSSDGVQLGLVARWDGSSWTPLGSGVNNTVYSLGVHDSGNGLGPELYVGGIFNRVGDFPSRTLAHWRSCQAPIDSMCFGDGTVAHCPCSNTGSPGRGCQNSIFNGGALLASTGTVHPDQLVLHASNELLNVLTIFLQGNALISGTVPFGDGLRCAGGNLKRLYVRTASGGMADAPLTGEPSISSRSAAVGDPLVPGSVRYYQTYYRDPSSTFCPPPAGGFFNSSNGLRVVW